MAGEEKEGLERIQSNTSFSSSSSLRFSDGRGFDEIVDEVIQEIHEAERERISGETQESGELVVVISDDEGLPQEGILPRVEEEESKRLNDWRAHMEGSMNQLRTEYASLNKRVRAQEEQINQLFGVVKRMFSGMVVDTQISRQPPPGNSSASQKHVHGTCAIHDECD